MVIGSYNFSAGATWNSEDLNIVTSPVVAEAYTAHWQLHMVDAVHFNGLANGAGDNGRGCANWFARPVRGGIGRNLADPVNCKRAIRRSL
jgi:hypothetical protein